MSASGLDLVFDLGAVLIRWEPALIVQQHFPQLAPDAQAGAELARQMFSHADWHRFDGGIFSGDVRLAKPQPEIFELLAARHGLEPARTVFIDDVLANVEAARALGWRAIHCTDTGALAAQVQAHLDAALPADN